MVKLFLKIAEVFRILATIAQFDQYAYTQTPCLKVDALNIMGTATNKFSSHQADATVVQPL